MAPSKNMILDRINAIGERGTLGEAAICLKDNITARTLRRWAANHQTHVSIVKTKGKHKTLHSGRHREKVRETAFLMAWVNNMIATRKGDLD
jgi:hypothetical protein